MPDTKIDFNAPAELRKWPSLNKQRVSASLGARPYMISEGTLDECIQQFMLLPEAQRHLYEIHTAPQSDLVSAVLSTDHVVELARLRDFSRKIAAPNGVDIVADLQQSPCFCAGIRRFNFTGVAGFATVRIPGGRGISLSNHFYPEAAGQALCGLFICARQAFPNSPSRASMLACPSLPAADRKIGNDCWHIYYGDVHAGTIAMPVGNPSDTDPWEWSCGFYPRVNSIRHVGARQQTGV